MQLEEYKKQLRKGGNDPWAVDYNSKVAEENSKPEEKEVLKDKAAYFSF